MSIAMSATRKVSLRKERNSRQTKRLPIRERRLCSYGAMESGKAHQTINISLLWSENVSLLAVYS